MRPIYNDDAGMLCLALETAKSALDNWQFKSGLSSIGTLYAAMSAGDALLLAYVLLLMCLDLAFGLVAAWKLGTYSPFRLHKGVMKFLSYSLTVVLVMTISSSANTSVGVNLHVQDFFMSYLIACEVMSITRHMKRLGLPVPDILVRLAFGAKKKAEDAVTHAFETHEPPDDGRPY